ncbi:MAG: hypothetical protein QXF14_00060 [Candidatus Woesearchaeota archaeon]
MGFGRLMTVLALLALNLVGMIFLEGKMSEYATLELVIIVVGILLSILALIGIAAESRWSWPFSTVLFSLFLANAVFLFVTVGAFVTFVLLLIVNIIGLLVSVLSIEDVVKEPASTHPPELPQIETYSAEEPAQVTYKAPKARRGRRKKK